jgi:subtilisin family serine protease
LRWAGTRADIINLSFGLGQNYLDSLTKAIDDLVKNKKLIFAAASNNGGNGSRPWPAKQPGVFCIHATNERGWANHKMNPTAMSSMDNFATLGENIESFWRGQKRCISGTSFATPVAAAIAANVLHFARAHLKKEDAAQLMRYYVMKTLMRNRMTDNGGSDGVYHYVKPWADELWAKGASDEDVVKVLLDVITYGR